MRKKYSSQKKILFFIISYLILWIVLFEFILPVNEIVPRPSIVILSFGALWTDYHLPVNFVSTISSVYISLFAAYFLLKILTSLLTRMDNLFTNFLLSLNWFSKYLPAIVFGIFLIYWFPNSNIIEFVFAFITAFFSLIITFQEETKKVGNEYLDSAVSLGAAENIIARKVIWKAVQPKIFKHLYNLHFKIWSILIIFEYIKGGYGLGEIFRLSLTYHDISALFSIAIITGVLIFLGAQIIKYFQNKFCHWSFN
jgi:ABC-type nitrate/sulfonate/bicarbonate transport system permease component